MNTRSSPIHVLHVDDNQELADLTATFLGREHDQIDVKTAASPEEGLDIVKDSDIDCVVSDYDMPEINGIEFLKTIRELYPDLPFILFTGKGSEAVASEAISAGVTEYLQKSTGNEQYKLLANRITTAVNQYRTEQTLERQNDLFSKAQDLADVGAWQYDLESEESYVTDEILRIHGLDPATTTDLPPEDSFEYYHPDDQPEIRAAFQQAIETGEPYDLEVRLVDDDDTLRWIHTRGEPQFENGDIVRLRGTVQDITERKKREQELESERNFIEQSLNCLNDIFYVTDTDGNFQRWNSTLPELTGYTNEEIGSMHALDFFEGEDVELIKAAIHNIVESGSDVTEAKITTVDGREVPHEFRGVLMTDADGEPTGLIGIARDITERKAREQKLKQKNDQLEKFTRIVSHDLRGPLQVAHGKLSLAQKETECAYLDDVGIALNRMETLLDDLLTLARDGDQIGDLAPINLETVLGDCWRTVSTAAATINVETNQTIQADESRLQQLLENLLRNAVEHGPKDITVTVGELTDKSGFYVEDDGPGIPEAKRDDVLQAGYSGAETGTGFGLSIVKQIVDAHEWEITVAESDNGGARFEITNVSTEA